jgi:putative RecB family exonuclease
MTVPSEQPEVGAGAAAGDRAVVGSLSPSRASDFQVCPLRYRFRVIDRIPERRSPEAARGTLVHRVLERLFDEPPAERTLDRAIGLLAPSWRDVVADDPELDELFPDAESLAEWLATAHPLLEAYFALEDPTRLAPAARELHLDHVLPSGLRLHGYLDRLDESASGAVRIVDYKTGRSPAPDWERRALFQMRFYALLLLRARGIVPAQLKLLYLADRAPLVYVPDEADLLALERTVTALWAAIRRAESTGDWRPRPSKLCAFCDHQVRCPEFGGTPPALPPPRLAADSGAGGGASSS